MTIVDMVKALEPEIKRALPSILTPERFTCMALSLTHRPSFDEPGEIRALYAIFRLDNDGFRFEVMSKSYVDAYATKYSKAFTSDFSLWKSNYEGMAKKTVFCYHIRI